MVTISGLEAEDTMLTVFVETVGSALALLADLIVSRKVYVTSTVLDGTWNEADAEFAAVRVTVGPAV